MVVEKRVVMKFMGREGLNFLILMGKRKRVYADQYGDWEATNNRKVQNTKALAKKGHGKVKDVPVKSKSGETKT